MAGKLGYGVYSNEYHFVNAVKERGAKLVLLCELALELAPSIRAVCPDTLIIGRKYFVSQTWNSVPYLAYQDGIRVADELQIKQYPDVDVWQSFNEAISNDDPLEKWVSYDMFERGFCDRVHYLGKKTIIGNIACGNGTAHELLLMWCSLQKADYFGYHAYTSKETPGLIDQWYFNRYRSWVEEFESRGLRFPPVIFTETGTYWPWKHPENYPPGECVELDPRPVFKLILEEMNKNKKVYGGAIFSLGDCGGWTGFNVDGENNIMPEDREENKMTWDRHQIYDAWFDSLVRSGFNPNTAIGKFRMEHPELGIPTTVELGADVDDWPYIYQGYANGIVVCEKGSWRCSIARLEDEIPLA